MKKQLIIFMVLFMFAGVLTSCSNVFSNPQDVKKVTTSKEIEIVDDDYEIKEVYGSRNNPITISSYEGLINSFNNKNTSCYYKLSGDIDCSNAKTTKSFNKFSGYLDGAGYKITDLSSDGALFDEVDGIIKNLIIENCSFYKTTVGSDAVCGVIANRLSGNGNISNCSFVDNRINANASSYNESENTKIRCIVGGVCGYMIENSSVSNCLISNLSVSCYSSYHDKGWQASIDEAPFTYFGGITGFVSDSCSITNNSIIDISCNSISYVRICYVPITFPVKLLGIYSYVSLAAIAGYGSNASSIGNNQVSINLDKLTSKLDGRDDYIPFKVGGYTNYCYISDSVGYKYGSCNVSSNDNASIDPIYRSGPNTLTK